MNGIAAAQIQHQPQITDSPSLSKADHPSTSTTTTAAPEPQIQPDNDSAPQHDSTISTNTDHAPVDAKTPDVHPLAGPTQSEQAAVDESKPSVENQWSDPAPQLQQQKIEEVGEVMLGHINGQIELVEHQPDTLVGSGDSGEVVETHEFPTEQDELKRVKVSLYAQLRPSPAFMPHVRGGGFCCLPSISYMSCACSQFARSMNLSARVGWTKAPHSVTVNSRSPQAKQFSLLVLNGTSKISYCQLLFGLMTSINGNKVRTGPWPLD